MRSNTFGGKLLVKDFTAFGNGYKIARGARNDAASRSPMRSTAAISRDLFYFSMYIYIIFSYIYIYICILYLYVFIDLRANKYYGIWQILCLT